MSIGLYSFPVTIPAGTAKATPQVTELTIPAYNVDRIEWQVPAGPNGCVGWFISMGGVQVVPYGQDNWVVTSDEVGAWDLENLPTSGAWELTAYNTGSYPHTVTVRLLVSLVSSTTSVATVTLIPSSTLSL